MQVLKIGEEGNKVIILDDFLENPQELVTFAKSAHFSPYPIAVERKGYPGVRAAAPASYGDLVRERVDAIIRAEFGVPTVAKLNTFQEALNLISVKEEDLGPLQRIPHFDASDPNFFAVLLYLCDDHHGGTGFYRHNSTGFERVTPERCDAYLDNCYEELNSQRWPKKYCLDEHKLFTRIGFVPAKFNRLVIYRGGTLHSANILGGHSISDCPETGRLTANVFIGYR
ncbi:DUF6445 family protein [Microbulbifer sp. HZ11]|uniref:DUF6445 family protein n=1 Tax=Microbulbifer sp. HZ11 TaxID=1453501 RepID=UPI0005BB65A0|nr:DUF6445 family protein [Microbulbifer sp. HZ11]